MASPQSCRTPIYFRTLDTPAYPSTPNITYSGFDRSDTGSVEVAVTDIIRVAVPDVTHIKMEFYNYFDDIPNANWVLLGEIKFHGVHEDQNGYWPMSGHTGAAVPDSSASGNHGLSHGAVGSAGYCGSGLTFEGDDYVEVTDNDNQAGMRQLSIAGWVFPSQYSLTEHTVLAKWGDQSTPDDSYRLAIYDNRLRFRVSGGTYDTEFNVDSLQEIPLGEWTHIAGVYDGENIRVYINGIIDNIEPAQSIEINETGESLFIGRTEEDYSYFFGTLDELRLFSYALSDSEVEPLMRCVDMIGLWSMNHVGAMVLDESGSGNNGILNGATWHTGYCSSGLLFDGDDFVEVPSSSSQAGMTGLSITAWVLPESVTTTAAVLAKQGSSSHPYPPYLIDIHDSHVRFQLSGGTLETTVSLLSTQTIAPGSWTHVAAVYDGSIMKLYLDGVLDSSKSIAQITLHDTAESISIGRAGPGDSYFHGIIDEVRLYDGAISAKAVSELLSCADLIGYWPFNEGSGSQVSDLSISGNDGIAYGGSWLTSGTGYAFDGDDYIAVADNSNQAGLDAISVAAWVFATELVGNNTILAKWGSSGSQDDSYQLSISDGFLHFSVSGTYSALTLDSTQTIPIEQWTHVAAVYDGSSMKIYLDGELDSSNGTPQITIRETSESLFLGRTEHADSFFHGALDEIRLYSGAISAEDISTLQDRPFFVDGFESGNTSQWLTVVQ